MSGLSLVLFGSFTAIYFSTKVRVFIIFAAIPGAMMIPSGIAASITGYQYYKNYYKEMNEDELNAIRLTIENKLLNAAQRYRETAQKLEELKNKINKEVELK